MCVVCPLLLLLLSLVLFFSAVQCSKSMEIQRSPLLHWSYDSQSKSMEEELRHCLLYKTLELETTKLAVEQELKKRDDQLIHLRQLLDTAARERDEAHDRCQRLLLENLVLQQHDQDEPRRQKDTKKGFLPPDCEESIVSPPPPPPPQVPTLDSILLGKPLPEKGKLLQAVMKAGPLLQTLLLAGPLPQWRHPPPPIESSAIPPVKIPSPAPPLPPPVFLQDALLSCSRVCGKRSVPADFEYPAAKYQRALLP